jgi:hypothetical protein
MVVLIFSRANECGGGPITTNMERKKLSLFGGPQLVAGLLPLPACSFPPLLPAPAAAGELTISDVKVHEWKKKDEAAGLFQCFPIRIWKILPRPTSGGNETLVMRMHKIVSCFISSQLDIRPLFGCRN